MSAVFKITDRFKITGRGIVYTLKPNENITIKIGDCLFDLCGHEFKVIGIEKPHRCWEYMPPIETLPIGILVELSSGFEAEGDVLIMKNEK